MQNSLKNTYHFTDYSTPRADMVCLYNLQLVASKLGFDVYTASKGQIVDGEIILGEPSLYFQTWVNRESTAWDMKNSLCPLTTAENPRYVGVRDYIQLNEDGSLSFSRDQGADLPALKATVFI